MGPSPSSGEPSLVCVPILDTPPWKIVRRAVRVSRGYGAGLFLIGHGSSPYTKRFLLLAWREDVVL